MRTLLAATAAAGLAAMAAGAAIAAGHPATTPGTAHAPAGHPATTPGTAHAPAGHPATTPAAAHEIAADAPAPVPFPADPDRFRVRIGNRMYPEWSDEVTVALNEPFFLGDTEFTAQASEYLPDFRINKGEAPHSASPDPNNPAIHVIVLRGGAAVDSSWAFLNFAPHFSPTSFFTFQLLPPAPPEAAAAEE
jgi:hypothetical protein